MATLHALANPARFLKIARPLTPALVWAGVALIALGCWAGLTQTPPDYLQGETVRVTLPTDSGRPHDVHRCAACGTTIWSDYGRREVLTFLRATTLDDRAALPPDVHIFTRSKLPWVRFPEGARVFDVYYDMQAEWPPESLARREALLGAGR